MCFDIVAPDVFLIGFLAGEGFFDELLEVAVEGMFGGVAEAVAFVYAVNVLFYGHLVVLYITKICFSMA